MVAVEPDRRPVEVPAVGLAGTADTTEVADEF